MTSFWGKVTKEYCLTFKRCGWSVVLARYGITFSTTHNLTSFGETEQFSVVHRKYLSCHCMKDLLKDLMKLKDLIKPKLVVELHTF